MDMEEEREISYGRMMMSPEIVEIGEDSRSFARDATGGNTASGDVYVAVGKDDVDVLKWVLDNLVVAGAGSGGGRRIFLVHVFPPVTYIPTPVGKLSRSQLSQDQVRVYINEENNRRRNLLHKYIRLCTDAKVPVDTMLIESDTTAKAIVDLIPVLNITNLVIGTNKSPYNPRLLMKKLGKGEYVRKNAPDYCDVSIVYNGQKVVMDLEAPAGPNTNPNHWSLSRRTASTTKPEISSQHKEWNFFKCACFSVTQTMKDDDVRERDSTNSEVVISTNQSTSS